MSTNMQWRHLAVNMLKCMSDQTLKSLPFAAACRQVDGRGEPKQKCAQRDDIKHITYLCLYVRGMLMLDGIIPSSSISIGFRTSINRIFPASSSSTNSSYHISFLSAAASAASLDFVTTSPMRPSSCLLRARAVSTAGLAAADQRKIIPHVGDFLMSQLLLNYFF